MLLFEFFQIEARPDFLARLIDSVLYFLHIHFAHYVKRLIRRHDSPVPLNVHYRLQNPQKNRRGVTKSVLQVADGNRA